MRPASRDERRQAARTHHFLGVGRVRRTIVAGEVVTVSLELIDDQQTTNIADGDEFVTLLMAIDPFQTPEEC